MFLKVNDTIIDLRGMVIEITYTNGKSPYSVVARQTGGTAAVVQWHLFHGTHEDCREFMESLYARLFIAGVAIEIRVVEVDDAQN